MTTDQQSKPPAKPPAKAPAKAARRAGADRERPPPDAGSIADLYQELIPAVAFAAEQTKLDVALTIPSEHLHNVLATSRRHSRLQMDLLRNQTAVDWEERGLEVVYHLYSTTLHHNVAIKTWVPDENPSLPTVSDIWRMADWAERECREMFGIEFVEHPDPRNLLLDEDLDLPLLRKRHPLAPVEIKQREDVDLFQQAHPPPAPAGAEEAGGAPAGDERSRRIAVAKEQAATSSPQAKPSAEMTPEELAAKKAAQAERVKRARALAAARRAELQKAGSE